MERAVFFNFPLPLPDILTKKEMYSQEKMKEMDKRLLALRRYL